MNTCEMCRWFGPMSEVNGNLGSCHRYPPRPFDPGHRRGNAGMFPSADFPVVTRQTSCGEHTPRESEASGRADQGVAATAPRSASTETPSSADATAGPYSFVAEAGTGFYHAWGPHYYRDDLRTEAEARKVVERLNAVYRAGQASMEPTDYNEGFEEGWKAGRDSMREPTEAMIEAGDNEMGSVVYPVKTAGLARAVWDAMWKARDN